MSELTVEEKEALIEELRNRLYNIGEANLTALLENLVARPIQHTVAIYDFAVDGGAIGAHEIGDDMPVGAIIVGGFVEPLTTATSATDAGTGALSVVGAGDIKAAVAISDVANPWDAGARKAIIPKFNTPESTSIKVAVANKVDFTIAVEAFTAGKFALHLFYIQSVDEE